MSKLLWRLRYAYLAYRSPYDFTIREAWHEAGASWEMNDYERGDDPMPTPSDAIYEDCFNACD